MIARRILYLLLHIVDKKASCDGEATLVPQLGESQKFFYSSFLSYKAIPVTLLVNDKG